VLHAMSMGEPIASSWDLGDPSGEVETFVDICNMGLPISTPDACDDFHPMKGPMLTQTLQDIIGKEPLHWRGDRAGIEAFGGAFMLINGDDGPLVGPEMQSFEDFLASIHFPPNPFRNLDNSLPVALELEGHFTTGRFGLGRGSAGGRKCRDRVGSLSNRRTRWRSPVRDLPRPTDRNRS